jgi:hypothetical protein
MKCSIARKNDFLLVFICRIISKVVRSTFDDALFKHSVVILGLNLDELHLIKTKDQNYPTVTRIKLSEEQVSIIKYVSKKV